MLVAIRSICRVIHNLEKRQLSVVAAALKILNMSQLLFLLSLLFLVSILCVDAAVDSFYDVIIKNNIFRPLGWRPPRQVIPYELLSTIIYPQEEKSPTAIIKETMGSVTHFVSTGDRIGDTVVVKIEPKQVTLNIAGKVVHLNIGQTYLNLSGRVRHRRLPTPSSDPSDHQARPQYVPRQVISVPF